MHHIGIATADLAGALAFYCDVLGMRQTWDEVVEEQGVRAVFLAPASGAATEIELLVATRDDSAIARFIAKRGPGLHHVAYEVEDINAALTGCRARGLRLVDERHGAAPADIGSPFFIRMPRAACWLNWWRTPPVT